MRLMFLALAASCAADKMPDFAYECVIVLFAIDDVARTALKFVVLRAILGLAAAKHVVRVGTGCVPVDAW